jgi:hypothetical protein
MLAPTLAVAIVMGYAAALWWLLRRESPMVWLSLALLCGLSLCLRFLYTTDYPSGLYEDEPNMLQSAMQALRSGRIFGESNVVIPVLLGSLFEAQLVPLLGPTRWAIRTYSMATSVLSTPAVFAVARAMGMRIIPGLAAGSLVAVLPWALFYGRIHLGGELLFHQLLLLAALARLVWMTGAWIEIAIGGFGLCLLLYDYWAGRAMLGMPVVAAVLARGWRRLACLAIIAVALIGYIPYLRARPYSAMRGVTDHIRPELVQHPLEDVYARSVVTLKTLVTPTACDGWGTIRTAAQHPPLILALALLGALISPLRRNLFLWAGFIGGIAATVLSDGPPSTHRMMMGYVFIVLAAASALDRVKWRRPRVAMAAVVVAVVGFQSVQMYFAPEFWPTESRWIFDWERTSLVEALPLPPHPRLIEMRQLGFYFAPRAMVDPEHEMLTVENWFPDERPAIYAFDWTAAALRPFYEGLLGYERVESYGRAFTVTLAGADWSWLRQHGWAYEAHCGDHAWRGQVPALYQPGITFKGLNCLHTATHVWRGQWHGPPAQMELRFSGAAVVEMSGQRVVEQEGHEKIATFTVEPETPLTITLDVPPDTSMFWAALMEMDPLGGHVPAWDRVSPITTADGAADARAPVPSS